MFILYSELDPVPLVLDPVPLSMGERNASTPLLQIAALKNHAEESFLLMLREFVSFFKSDSLTNSLKRSREFCRYSSIPSGPG